jgi:hypothetical protein
MNTDNTQGGAEPSLASAGSRPVAYEVWWDGAARQPYCVSADEKPSGNWTPAPRIVPLYRKPHPTLTDEEREAIGEAACICEDAGRTEIAVVVNTALERLG